MENILITGGAGFIGSNLALRLISIGYQVTVLDNLSPQVHTENSALYDSIKNKVKFIKGDVRSKEDWLAALAGQNAVVHLAAETGTGQSMYEIEKYTDVNIKGTAILLDYLTNETHNIQKIIVASSRAIYGEGKYNCTQHGDVYPSERSESDLAKKDFEVKCPHCNSNVTLVGTDEASKIHPSSIYGITKQNQEQMVMVTCQSLGIPAVAFRYQNVYGPGQSLSNPYTGILSIFSTRIKNNNDLNIFEDGEESRDFVYIDDVVSATVKGLEQSAADGEVFNIGSGVGTTVLTVANALKQNYQSDIEISISGNYRVGDIRHNVADLTKAKEKLGFEPQVTFLKGVEQFTAWVNNQAVEDDCYEDSISEMKEKGLYK
jgi:dTDP-L-rhamnose 4-epimerase